WTSTPAATSTRWGCCCTSCSPARRRWSTGGGRGGGGWGGWGASAGGGGPAPATARGRRGEGGRARAGGGRGRGGRTRGGGGGGARTGGYETANGLARDLDRHLHDEPVQAGPPSAWYRFHKFARRNRAALVTATVVALAVLLAVGTFGWSLRDQAARRAEAERG